jgi:hypothetical protein
MPYNYTEVIRAGDEADRGIGIIRGGVVEDGFKGD